MREGSSRSLAGVLLGAALVIGGIVAAIWPHAGLVPHHKISSADGPPELTTITMARTCGVLAILLGVAVLKISTLRDD
jgi:hypothetical protein